MDISINAFGSNCKSYIGALMLPTELESWVQKVQGEYQIVNLDPCVQEQGLDFTCEGELGMPRHVCLNLDNGKCHYDLKLLVEHSLCW